MKAIKEIFTTKLSFSLRNNDRILSRLHSTMFVPRSQAVLEQELDILREFLYKSKKLFVLTGAGVSTESGIPDYRSEKVGLYARSKHRPIQYQEFLKSGSRRQRYWARNYMAWPQFSSFQPNICHSMLSSWERSGQLSWLVTQNVDALHTKAGSRRLTELHGCSHRVECLSCPHRMPRTYLQELIHRYNPDWYAESIEIAPDGDVQLDDQQVESFQVPPCPSCGGILKPEITFFGDNVEKSKVNFVFDKIRESDGFLLIGTSLQVYSGYRFLLAAQKDRKPIGAINIGQIRGENLINFKVNAKCGDVFSFL